MYFIHRNKTSKELVTTKNMHLEAINVEKNVSTYMY